VSIWCAGSSEKVYAATRTAQCPVCGKNVDVTAQGHIKPHVESKTADAGKK
jgi:Zn finger protein HypA/HybF involved in hydrogenase expression